MIHVYTVMCVLKLVEYAQDINERLKRLTKSTKCVLFMKGTPEEPRCGEQ